MMRYILSILFFVFGLSNYSYSQFGSSGPEIYMCVFGYDALPSSIFVMGYRIKAEAMNDYWVETDDIFYLKDRTDPIYNKAFFPVNSDNMDKNNWMSADFVNEDNPRDWYGFAAYWDATDDLDEIAYGIYKISVDLLYENEQGIPSIKTIDYFYIDCRDANWGTYSTPPYSQLNEIDIDIKYTFPSNLINSYGYPIDLHTDFEIDRGHLTGIWEPLPRESTIRYWEIKEVGPPNTTPLTTSSGVQYLNLEVPQNISITGLRGQNATINWAPVQGAYHYKVFRAYEDGGPMGPYSLVATTSSTSWTDPFVTIERFTNAIYHYKVQTIMGDAGNPGYTTMLSDSASVSGPVYNQDETLETQSIEQIKRFRLFDNYPNPFNPVTTLSFFLPEDNYVKIEIYNIYGEISSTEVNGFFKEGYHTIKFDGSNLPSGTYYYKIAAGKYTETKKMLIVK